MLRMGQSSLLRSEFQISYISLSLQAGFINNLADFFKIIQVGFMQNLAELLSSPPDEISELNGVELVRQKVAMRITR